MRNDIVEVPRSEIVQQLPLYFDHEGKFLHATHAEDMIDRLKCVFDGQTLWRYQDGYFRNDGEAYYKVIGQQLIGKSSTQRYIKESLYYAQNEVRLLDNQLNPPIPYINLKNGMLNPLTGDIMSHSPKYLSTVQLPIEYDPKANDPIIHNFVSSVLPEDSHDAFYEMIGYMLTNNLHLEKAFMFLGGGSNGKSVAIDMVTALIGKCNVANVSLQDLGHRFRAGGIEGKLLNAFSDLPQKPIEDTGIFKAIVSQEAITIEHKNKDPKVIKPTVKLLFSANHMVVTPDMTDGYFRRWLLFEFNNKFTDDNKDINLIHKLTTPEALATLLNKAIEGVKRLHINQRFTQGESLKNSTEKYKMHCDNVRQFVEEQCEVNKDYFISTKDLYIRYREFCEEWGIKNMLGKKNFNTRLAESLGINFKYKKIQRESVQCWFGIKLKSSDEYDDPFNK
jgi:P4 family phage/plasmid primase-like protien